jgi:hypothetical protein
MRLDSSGNLGLGVTPSAWSSDFKGIDIAGTSASFISSSSRNIIASNTFYNGTSYIYKNSDFALMYWLDRPTGQYRWYNSPSGTAGNAITFTQAMTLSAAGRLLIGKTNDEGFALDVVGTGRFIGGTSNIPLQITSSSSNGTILGLINTNAGTNSWGINSYTNGILFFQYGTLGSGSNPFYVTSLGAATFSSSVTATNLLTTSMSGGAINIRGNETLNSNFGIMWTTPTYVGGLAAIRVQRTGAADASDMMFFTSPNGDIPNERMRITSGGNVLIGATSEVSSGRRELVMRGANGSVISLGNNTTADRFQIVSDSGENALLNNKANTPMVFYTNNTEVMRILSGGNVGIGTTSPTTKLEVIGGTSNVNGYADGTIQVTSLSPIAFVVPSNLNPSLNRWGFRLREVNEGDFSIYDYRNSVNRVLINSSGNVGIGTTSPSEIFHVNKNNAGNIVGGYFTNSQANTGAESVSLAFGLNRSGGDFVRQIKAITFGAEQQWTGTESTVDGYLSFSTVQNEAVSERMRITSGGQLLVNTTNTDIGGSVNGIALSSENKILVSNNTTGIGSFLFYGDRRGTNNEGIVYMLAMGGFYKASIGVLGQNDSLNNGGITFSTISGNTTVS